MNSDLYTYILGQWLTSNHPQHHNLSFDISSVIEAHLKPTATFLSKLSPFRSILQLSLYGII